MNMERAPTATISIRSVTTTPEAPRRSRRQLCLNGRAVRLI